MNNPLRNYNLPFAGKIDDMGWRKRWNRGAARRLRATFVCGCGHSGTTLIANILAGHPQVFVALRETETFLHGRQEAERRLAELMAEFRADGRRQLVEKTPRHVRKLSLIRELVPGARFVVPVRDGRDVTASIAERIGSPEIGVRRWIDDNRIVLAECDARDVHVYRHEDLVADPEQVVRSVCAFMHIPFCDGLLRYHERERLWFGMHAVEDAVPDVAHEQHRNWQVNQPIFDSRGRWRETLTEADFRPLLEGEGAQLMRAFGYLDAPSARAAGPSRRADPA